MLETYLMALKLAWFNSYGRLRLQFVLATFSGVLKGVFIFLTSYYLGVFIEDLQNTQAQALPQSFYLLILVSFLLVLSNIIFRLSEVVFENISLRVNMYFFRKFYEKSTQWHANQSIGYLLTAVKNIEKNLKHLMFMTSWEYVAQITLVVVFVFYISQLSVWLMLYFIMSMVAILFVTQFTYKRRHLLNLNTTEKRVDFGHIYVDFLQNIRTVKKMFLKDYADSEMEKSYQKVKKANWKSYSFNAMQWGFVDFVVPLMFYPPLGYLGYEYITTGEGLSVIVVIASIKPFFARFVQRFMNLMLELSYHKADYTILKNVLDDEKIQNKKLDDQGLENWQSIEFKDTVYKYNRNEQSFVHKVPYFQLKKGEHIAVMGRSGEGKTTFLNLLTHNFFVDEGNIFVDGTPYTEMDERFFETHFTYIAQDVELLNRSLYENIVLGRENITDTEFSKIIEGCQLGKLIEKMGGDIHANIGEKGVKVSAGEKQRINIARGLLMDRDILVLDEITANLDPATTKKIWTFIFEHYGNKTIMAISHEDELVKHVDRCITFKYGTLVAE